MKNKLVCAVGVVLTVLAVAVLAEGPSLSPSIPVIPAPIPTSPIPSITANPEFSPARAIIPTPTPSNGR